MGVKTSGHDARDEGLGSEQVFHEACEWLPVRRVLRRLNPGPDDVFADIGSGKGQALLIAGEMPFGRVLGVEVSEQGHRNAEANVARARPRLRCPEVRSVAADVLDWDIPHDVSVVFLYCPFIGELFRSAVQRLFDSHDSAPRPLRIVYDFPWEHDWLISTGRVVVEDVAPAQWPPKPWWWRSGWVIVTYRVVPAGAGGADTPRLPRRFLRPRRAVERWSRPNGHRFRLYRPGQPPLHSG